MHNHVEREKRKFRNSVKNYKENLIFIDNKKKKGENRLLKSPIRYKKRYANPNKNTENNTG